MPLQKEPTQDMKYELADAVEALLTDDGKKSYLKVEVTRIAPLQIQVKTYPETGMPRYFNVRISEGL